MTDSDGGRKTRGGLLWVAAAANMAGDARGDWESVRLVREKEDDGELPDSGDADTIVYPRWRNRSMYASVAALFYLIAIVVIDAQSSGLSAVVSSVTKDEVVRTESQETFEHEYELEHESIQEQTNAELPSQEPQQDKEMSNQFDGEKSRYYNNNEEIVGKSGNESNITTSISGEGISVRPQERLRVPASVTSRLNKTTFGDPNDVMLHVLKNPLKLSYEDAEYAQTPWASKYDTTQRKDPGSFSFRKAPILINLGLAKTGTLSLWQALVRLGIEPTVASHYVCPRAKTPARQNGGKKVRIPPSRCNTNFMCAGQIFEAVGKGYRPFDLSASKYFCQMDSVSPSSFLMPQMTLLKKILADYGPEEVAFVMTTRSNAGWLRSARKTSYMFESFVYSFGGGERVYEGQEFPAASLRNIGRKGSNPESEALMTVFKNWHEQRMRSLTKGYFFIELNLDEPVGLQRNFTVLAKNALLWPIPEDFEYPVSHTHFLKNGTKVNHSLR